MFLARASWKGLGALAILHAALLGVSYLLLSLNFFVPFAGLLLALDATYLLSARREARLRIEAEVKERRFLERALLDTSERERRSIGHELHDGVCQQISGALLRCRVAERSMRDREAPELPHLQAVTDLLDASLGETHNLAQGLSPSDLTPGSLGSALEELARRTRETHEVLCEVEEDGCSTHLDGPITTQLYRIAQEAVANALKHGHPEEIRISLRSEADRIYLRIENDGLPLGTTHSKIQIGGMGQRIMRYRAELIQGILILESLDQGGVVLTCSIPSRPLESSHA
jgi:signal transduction histidine kinase